MKKTSIILCLILTYFVVFFLQANVFQFFTIFDVKPNLFIIFILFVGLYANTTCGISFAVIGGLIIDLMYNKAIGITAIMLCIVGYLGSYFDKNFSKDNKITIIIMVAVVTTIYEVGFYALNVIILKFDAEVTSFIKILICEVIYNILLTIILYSIIQKFGYSIDRAFKKNNILTRYF